MANKIFRVFLEKLGGRNSQNYIGNEGDLFFDPSIPALKMSDGSTPGGVSLGGEGSSSLVTPSISWTGDMLKSITVRSIPPKLAMTYPSNTLFSSTGCWINGLSYEEDNNGTIPGITSITLNNIVGIENEIYLQDNAILESISAPLLQFIDDAIYITDNPLLETVSFPVLAFAAGNIQINSSTVLTSVVFPELLICEGFRLEYCDSLVEVDFTTMLPKIERIEGSIELTNNPLLETINIVCPYTENYYIHNNPSLTSLVIDVEYMGYTSMYNMDALTNFRFGSSLKGVDSSFGLNVLLDEESVDHILTTLAGLDGTGGKVLYENKTVELTGNNAIPSALGLAAVTVLEGRGCSVSVNSA